MRVDTGKSIKRQVRNLPQNVQEYIKSFISELKSLDSAKDINSEKLSGTKDRYKIRLGNYRIVYQKISVNHIEITSVRDRKEVYKKLFGITFSL